MRDRAPLRFVAPDWLRDNIRADLARQLPGDNTYAVADAEIERFFTVRAVNVTWTPDGGGQNFGAQGAGALINWPSTVETLLFHEGGFLFVDAGELNFGLEIRDSSLNETNDTRAMTETFENVAFVGIESLAVTFDICPDGSSAGTVDINPCATGS